MHNFFLGREIVVAIRTGFFDGFFQQPFEISRVWRMAIQTITRFHRLMLDLAGRQRIVVTGEAQRIARSQQQFFIEGLMRRMAALAIAFLHWRMLHLAGHKFFLKFLMAGKTRFARLALHRLGKRRFVTGGAIALGVRRMHDEWRARWCRWRRHCDLASGIGGRNGRDRRGRHRIRRARLRHAIEEKRQPLLFGFRGAAC